MRHHVMEFYDDDDRLCDIIFDYSIEFRKIRFYSSIA